MQKRHSAMTAAGLIVLHSSPRQLRDEAVRILRDLESCYLKAESRGLPAGVKLIRAHAA
jgi:hypothetical protein